VTASWVAASVRARALARRRLGADGARSLAASSGPSEAVASLAASPYGHDVVAHHTVEEAQRAAAATLLWHLRVLGGWVPRAGTSALRVLTAGFEVANVDEHLRALRGASADPPFRLGSAATAWPRLARAASRREVCDVLASSAWGDPGAEDERAIRLAMRLSWASRVAQAVPPARRWAAGAAALLIAREVLAADRPVPPEVARLGDPVLGRAWTGARTAAVLCDALPPDAAWALAAVHGPDDLWLAEATWWRALDHDGFALLRTAASGLEPVVGAVGVLAADAWRVRAALDVAGAGSGAREAFDAVA
jgi:hypothetical protein